MGSVAIRPPENYAELVDGAAIAVTGDAPTAGLYAFIHLFVRDTAELEAMLPGLEPRLSESGIIWVSWPKKTSAMFKDLTEDGIRAVALPMGLVDVKVAAVDEDWSGLKLVRRKAG
ncbi:MAG: DUF3052 family protein [Alphaproteobacteria bacterium]|nr:DUF3052 family protein [Alphaproteobacteria bacterium]